MTWIVIGTNERVNQKDFSAWNFALWISLKQRSLYAIHCGTVHKLPRSKSYRVKSAWHCSDFGIISFRSWPWQCSIERGPLITTKKNKMQTVGRINEFFWRSLYERVPDVSSPSEFYRIATAAENACGCRSFATVDLNIFLSIFQLACASLLARAISLIRQYERAKKGLIRIISHKSRIICRSMVSIKCCPKIAEPFFLFLSNVDLNCHVFFARPLYFGAFFKALKFCKKITVKNDKESN